MLRFRYFALASLAALFVATASASAATTVGSDCPVTDGVLQSVGVGLADSSQEIKSYGVITSWGVNIPFEPAALPISLIVGHPLQAPENAFSITGVSGTQLMEEGQLSFATRLPVDPGTRIGMGFTPLYCNAPGNALRYGGTATAPIVGATVVLGSELSDAANAAWANLEPDVDRDGYGDETQDGCPELAEFHRPCPAPTLDLVQIPYALGFRALVASGVPATLRAIARMRLPSRNNGNNGNNGNGNGNGNGRLRTRTVKGSPVSCQANTFCAVKVNWPQALRTARRALPQNKSFKIDVTVVATFAGQSATEAFKIKLPGRRPNR